MEKLPISGPSGGCPRSQANQETAEPSGSQSHYGGCPVHTVSAGDVTYQDYLKVPELLALQQPLSVPAHHDELLFIVIHQAYELWFKLVLHEMTTSIDYMQKGNILRAHHFMNRCVQILKLLVQQIHILETMSPVEFLEFRENLMPASGFQSVQFREIEFLAGVKGAEAEKYLGFFKNRPDFLEALQKRLDGPDLRSAYYGLLASLGFAIPPHAAQNEVSDPDQVRPQIVQGILPIYQKPSDHLPLYLLSESLIEFDQYLGLWREHHVRVVERVIGFKQGTGGSSGVMYLRSTTSKKCFPALWEVRTQLSK